MRFLSWLRGVFRSSRGQGTIVDPAVEVDRALRETASELGRFRSELARALFDERKLEGVVRDEQLRVDEARRRAELLMASCEETPAREALTAQVEVERRVRDAEGRLEAHRRTVHRLKESLRLLALRLDDATRRRNVLLARQRGAQAKQAIATSLGGAEGPTSFDDWEQRVRVMERDAHLSLDVLSDLGSGETDVDGMYREAADAARVDAAIEELRQRLRGAGGKPERT